MYHITPVHTLLTPAHSFLTTGDTSFPFIWPGDGVADASAICAVSNCSTLLFPIHTLHRSPPYDPNFHHLQQQYQLSPQTHIYEHPPFFLTIFNRPGVAGAVLHTPP